MIYVSIQIWPGGDRARAREIASAQMSNVSGLADVSEYHCSYSTRGDLSLGIQPEEGWARVVEHRRSDGVMILLREALKLMVKGRRK